MTLPNLRINQRNVLRLIAYHESKHPDEPCYLRSVTASSRAVYVRSVITLEEHGLIEIDRAGPDFKSWKVKLLIPFEQIITA